MNCSLRDFIIVSENFDMLIHLRALIIHEKHVSYRKLSNTIRVRNFEIVSINHTNANIVYLSEKRGEQGGIINFLE